MICWGFDIRGCCDVDVEVESDGDGEMKLEIRGKIGSRDGINVSKYAKGGVDVIIDDIIC